MISTFTSNTAYIRGGAVAISATTTSLTPSSDVDIKNNRMSFNSAGTSGAAVDICVVGIGSLHINVVNNEMSTNNAPNGAGVYIHANTPFLTFNMFNNTIADNVASGQGGWLGAGNINSDPEFADGYYLKAGSPCVDAGDDSRAPLRDIDGNSRVGRSDIGAHERQ